MTVYRSLYKEEEEILDDLSNAWNKFCNLEEVIHTSDKEEFMHAIHIAQNIIMSRPVARSMEE